MPLQIVSHPDYDAGFPASHRFPMGKYGALIEALSARGLMNAAERPAKPPPEWLKLAHDPTYVEQVLACTVPPGIEREIGFAIGERVSLRAQLASAGTILAARLALAHGIACNAAGGSHHARRAHGAGFCTFNDVAIASLLLLSEGAVGNVLVVDLDVHQGDGTAEILAAEERAFTFSMHGDRNYPVRKAKSDWDIPLPDGMSDEAYLATLREALPKLAGLRPWDLVFYNAGVDPHGEDRLGRLAMTDAGLRARERLVIECFRARRVPVCGVLGGGYSPDVRALAERHAILFEVAAEFG
ncbi:histone deacetylase [Arvimicrobium flavum]|uniref:histone deacetylase family protein n=1 Tax=Arvimicrobium flavum TaxID=3393320 RepID=UPI00237C30FE|nr:histone deacetylase [Mesorhizobium shangrilense]